MCLRHFVLVVYEYQIAQRYNRLCTFLFLKNALFCCWPAVLFC